MTITTLRPLAAGNAIQVVISPPRHARYWRILRRTADEFTGYADAGAVTIAAETRDNAIVDSCGLVNATPYFYREYDWIDGAWVDSGSSVSGTPAATYAGDMIDPQFIVRERIELGLAVEVARGALIPQTGVIKVTTAPFGLRDGIAFPTASVHYENGSPAHRALGEMLYADTVDVTCSYAEVTSGWLERTSLKIVGVSLNGDERIALRQAILRVVQANLLVFEEAGLLEIEFSQADNEDFTTESAPLYRTEGTFTCISPAYVQDQLPLITVVSVSVNNETPVT